MRARTVSDFSFCISRLLGQAQLVDCYGKITQLVAKAVPTFLFACLGESIGGSL